MVKFSRELEAQLIPEWKEKFVDYKQLKKHVKKIKLSLLRPSSAQSSSSSDEAMPMLDGGGRFGFSVLDPVRSLAARFLPFTKHFTPTDEENLYEMELAQSREDEVKEFMEKLDEELEKVNSFYSSKETEFCDRGEALLKQLQILLDLKHVLHEYRRRRRRQLDFISSSPTTPLSPAASCTTTTAPDDDCVSFRCLSSASSFSGIEVELPAVAEGGAITTTCANTTTAPSTVAEEVIAALERHGVSLVGGRAKAKRGGKPKVTTLRIDIPATTPARTIMWEDLANGSRKEEAAGGVNNGEYVTRKKLQHAEKVIRTAFVELYRGLGLLKTYSSLNMTAFRKITKKFDKVTLNQQEASSLFMKKVKASHFISSDKIVKLSDEIESVFTKEFAGNEKKKAMKFLRPPQHNGGGSHLLTFFVGLFTGCFMTLFSVYAILAHLCGIFSASSTQDQDGYMETVYPVFSMGALLSLHVFLYGCNLETWKSTRINHNFIFEFSSSTALKPKDAFLICASLMTSVVTAMVVHLLLRSAGVFPQHVDAIPGAYHGIVPYFQLFIGILLCPFNICYRSTRYCFLRVIRNIVFSPLYRVVMVDFFMADQLTSQIPLLRHMEYTACYFIAAGFRTHPYDTCTRSHQYKVLAYIISFLPYYWRAMQCGRRYVEEGNDSNHLANAGKYVSAMLAAAARMKYAVDPSPLWLTVAVLTCTGATFYQLYWDFVKDWGLLDMKSKNLWLRDELILKSRCTYYVSMALNVVLRLAWIESVTHLNLGHIEHRLIDFLLASLEIIRRGHWNFYRLENEHLNNVGKFRAVKTVPLPFRELESDD